MINYTFPHSNAPQLCAKQYHYKYYYYYYHQVTIMIVTNTYYNYYVVNILYFHCLWIQPSPQLAAVHEKFQWMSPCALTESLRMLRKVRLNRMEN